MIQNNLTGYGNGGGLFSFRSDGNARLVLDNVVFRNNTAHWGGGLSANSYLFADRVAFINNTAVDPDQTGDFGEGGGVYLDGPAINATLQNCTISGNTAWGSPSGSGGGGGIKLTRGSLTMKHCTVTDNTALNDTGGGIKRSNSQFGKLVDKENKPGKYYDAW